MCFSVLFFYARLKISTLKGIAVPYKYSMNLQSLNAVFISLYSPFINLLLTEFFVAHSKYIFTVISALLLLYLLDRRFI